MTRWCWTVMALVVSLTGACYPVSPNGGDDQDVSSNPDGGVGSPPVEGTCRIPQEDCASLCAGKADAKSCAGRGCDWWVARDCCLSSPSAGFACVGPSTNVATCVAQISQCYAMGAGIAYPCANFGGSSVGSRCGTQVADSECGGASYGRLCCLGLCGADRPSWHTGLTCCVTSCEGSVDVVNTCADECRNFGKNGGTVCEVDTDCCPGKGFKCIAGVCQVPCKQMGETCGGTLGGQCCSDSLHSPICSGVCCLPPGSACNSSSTCCNGLSCNSIVDPWPGYSNQLCCTWDSRDVHNPNSCAHYVRETTSGASRGDQER